jgi:hypothetical protein
LSFGQNIFTFEPTLGASRYSAKLRFALEEVLDTLAALASTVFGNVTGVGAGFFAAFPIGGVGTFPLLWPCTPFGVPFPDGADGALFREKNENILVCPFPFAGFFAFLLIVACVYVYVYKCILHVVATTKKYKQNKTRKFLIQMFSICNNYKININNNNKKAKEYTLLIYSFVKLFFKTF